MRYSMGPKDQIFAKGYRFFSFAKIMRKHIVKNISKNLGDKYSQKFLDLAKLSATESRKSASRRSIIKLLIKLPKYQKLHCLIIQSQLEVKQK